MSISIKKLAVVIITANRSSAVEGFIEYCINDLNMLNIDCIIYDSSDNCETFIIAEKYMKYSNNIYYYRYNKSDLISIDDKLISCYKLLYNKYKYIWPIRDGLSVRFSDCVNAIDAEFDNDRDIIIVNETIRDVYKIGSKEYIDPVIMFKEQCMHMNTLGFVICKNSFIKQVIDEVPVSKKNYGMWQPMAFFEYFSKHDLNAFSYVGKLLKENPKAHKSSFWTRNLLWQWAARWYQMIDQLPNIYDLYKKDVMKIKTYDFQPFKVEYIAKSRSLGGISIKEINDYKKYLPYVCDTPLWKFYVIAVLPKRLAPIIVKKIQRMKDNYHHFLNKHIRRIGLHR